jgi:hypothetical protein
MKFYIGVNNEDNYIVTTGVLTIPISEFNKRVKTYYEVNRQLHDLLDENFFDSLGRYRWKVQEGRLLDSDTKIKIPLDLLLENRSILESLKRSICLGSEEQTAKQFDQDRYEKSAKEINSEFDKIGIK